jgi:hypothetical protein
MTCVTCCWLLRLDHAPLTGYCWTAFRGSDWIPSREQVGKLYGRKRIMASVLQKAQSNSVVANIVEYVVMLFVVLMTGVSTLRLLGMLP